MIKNYYRFATRFIALCSMPENLPIPAPEKTRDARKKISVFTYGIIVELSKNTALNEDVVYAHYLRMGGLNSEQANTIVTRTREEFIKREFGEDCLQVATHVVQKWQVGDKNFQSWVKQLL